MLYDYTGESVHQGTTVKELVWDVFNDTALPTWLSLTGTDAEIAFSGTDTSRGMCTLTTKAASPTNGDSAGIETAFDIKSDEFEEIGFFVHSVQCDVAAAQGNHKMQIFMGDSTTTGAVMENAGSGTTHTATIFPEAPREIDWLFSITANARKRKDLGVVIRPRKKEVWFVSGDPDDRARPIIYDIGSWEDLTSSLAIRIITMGAAQRSFSFSKVTVRLCHY